MNEIVLCILMVGGLMCWGNTTDKRNELMLKKHGFVITANCFPLNDFQMLFGIREDAETVGKEPAKEKDAFDTGITTETELSVQQWFFLKPPDF